MAYIIAKSPTGLSLCLYLAGVTGLSITTSLRSDESLTAKGHFSDRTSGLRPLSGQAFSVQAPARAWPPRTCDYGIFAAQKSLSQNQVLTSQQNKIAQTYGLSDFIWQEIADVFRTSAIEVYDNASFQKLIKSFGLKGNLIT